MRNRVNGVVCIFVLSVTAFAQPREVKPGFNLFSKEQDVQLGREAAAQIERQVQVVRDAELNSYIQSIGRRLASTPEAGGYPYTFKVVNDQSINAFALPGGPTYVHTGLIRAADNEAQLAGVMAHEIAHVALRHGTNQASKANLLQLPALLAGAVVGGGGSMLGQLAQLGIGLGFNSVLLKFSRDAERDADILGARMLAKAGYNPIEMARFFEKLAASGGSRGPQFLSSHPDPGNRMKTVQEEIRYLPQRDYATNITGDFKEAQAEISGLPAPSKSSRSRVEGNGGDPQPSGDFREYRGREFSIAYPTNWEAFGDPESAMLTLAPRSGLVQDNSGNVAVAYGTMVSYYFPQRNNANLQRATEDLIGQLRQSNPSMRASNQRARRTTVGGHNALVTTLYSQSPYRGQNELDMLVTVERPEGIFYIVFVAPESDWRAFQPTFDHMLRSVRFSR